MLKKLIKINNRNRYYHLLTNKDINYSLKRKYLNDTLLVVDNKGDFRVTLSKQFYINLAKNGKLKFNHKKTKHLVISNKEKSNNFYNKNNPFILSTLNNISINKNKLKILGENYHSYKIKNNKEQDAPNIYKYKTNFQKALIDINYNYNNINILNSSNMHENNKNNVITNSRLKTQIHDSNNADKKNKNFFKNIFTETKNKSFLNKLKSNKFIKHLDNNYNINSNINSAYNEFKKYLFKVINSLDNDNLEKTQYNKNKQIEYHKVNSLNNTIKEKHLDLIDKTNKHITEYEEYSDNSNSSTNFKLKIKQKLHDKRSLNYKENNNFNNNNNDKLYNKINCIHEMNKSKDIVKNLVLQKNKSILKNIEFYKNKFVDSSKNNVRLTININ